MITTPYSRINTVLARTPPARLYQYTSATGLIGIATSKSLWATHIHFLNDLKELEHAVDYAKLCIRNRYEGTGSASTIKEPREIELLKKMNSLAGAVDSTVFVVSLTENRDQLSQWRGYCPPEGGYAVGFRADHLAKLASNQGFYFSQCVYDHTTQYLITMEIVDAYITAFRVALANGEEEGLARDRVAIDFARQLSRYGVILKHESFKEEAEWRLISPVLPIRHPRVLHRPGVGQIVPYTTFMLEDENNHLVELEGVVGPTADYPAANHGLQSLLYSAFPNAQVWLGRSSVPYKTTK